jgi:hypothetical protein
MARCRWSVLFSRLFDSLQPHRADMAERLDLLVLVAVKMAVCCSISKKSPASGFKPSSLLASGGCGDREFHWTSAAVVAVRKSMSQPAKNKQRARLR